MSNLRDLFPTEDYRFRMTMRRGNPADFFRAQDDTGRLLSERNRWLDLEPQNYAALLPEGVGLLEEVADLAAAWGIDRSGDIVALARKWEPDFLLLSPDDEGQFRLRGGALCFPTGWALNRKLGETLATIHGVVPGLNPAIGPAIDQFLRGLKPGPAFLRENWGITANEELNLHPTRLISSHRLPINLDAMWLRVEHQMLVALPRSRGVLFGIRIALHRLDGLAADSELALGLGNALRAMPSAMAIYKGLAEVRESLAAVLIARK